MNKKELEKIIEQSKPGYECKKCIWGKTLIDDKTYDVLNVMCMFPHCIKKKKKED